MTLADIDFWRGGGVVKGGDGGGGGEVDGSKI